MGDDNMKLKVGDVVRKPTGLFVVTDISKEKGVKFEDFKNYINNNYYIEFNGDRLSLNEINEILCEEYLTLGKKTVIEID